MSWSVNVIHHCLEIRIEYIGKNRYNGWIGCWPCFLGLLLPLFTTQGSVSETDNFLFSRLAFSWSPSWGAEQTLFSPSSLHMEPCTRSEWARLRPGLSRLSHRFWMMTEDRGVKRFHGFLYTIMNQVINYMISLSRVSVPPGCPQRGALMWRGPGVVFGLGSVVQLGHRPRGFYCAREARCSGLFPSGRPWRSHQPGRGGHTGSVKKRHSVCHLKSISAHNYDYETQSPQGWDECEGGWCKSGTALSYFT